MDNNTETFWKWGSRELAVITGTIALMVGVYIWVIMPIENLQTNIAVINEKLDSIITWENSREASLSTMKQELNLTFTDIYEKLGSKYVPK